MAISDYFKSLQLGNSSAPPANPVSGAQQVQETLNTFMDPNSDYMKNARQRGVEYAATRGGVNSSIAAGASERSALEAAQPMVQQAVSIDQGREDVAMQDWLSKQNFNRALTGQVFNNSMGMLQAVQNFALNDPALYTPDVVSGYSNFFQKNMDDVLNQYFGGGV